MALTAGALALVTSTACDGTPSTAVSSDPLTAAEARRDYRFTYLETDYVDLWDDLREAFFVPRGYGNGRPLRLAPQDAWDALANHYETSGMGECREAIVGFDPRFVIDTYFEKDPGCDSIINAKQNGNLGIVIEDEGGPEAGFATSFCDSRIFDAGYYRDFITREVARNPDTDLAEYVRDELRRNGNPEDGLSDAKLCAIWKKRALPQGTMRPRALVPPNTSAATLRSRSSTTATSARHLVTSCAMAFRHVTSRLPLPSSQHLPPCQRRRRGHPPHLHRCQATTSLPSRRTHALAHQQPRALGAPLPIAPTPLAGAAQLPA